MIPMPHPSPEQPVPDFDFTVYDEAFLAAEAELAESALRNEPEGDVLTVDDLREWAERLRSSIEEGDDLEPPR